MTDDRRLTDANLLALNGRDGEASGKLADWLKDQNLHALRRLVIRGMLAELEAPAVQPGPDVARCGWSGGKAPMPGCECATCSARREPQPEPVDNMQRALVEIAQEMGGELLPDTKTHKHRMEIRSSNSSNLYMVSYCRGYGNRPEGWECSCMGWKAYHSRFDNYHCRHLKAMVPALNAATRPGGALAS